MTTKVIIDLDTGIDDALAMVYALHSPELEILGFTTCFGNHEVKTTTQNTLRVLELLKKEHIPVISGADKPLFRKELKGKATYIHGEDGLGNVNLPEPRTLPLQEHAVDFITRTVNEHPNAVTIIILGTLTNLALSLMKDPSLAHKVKNVVIMGGAVLCPGNVTPVAEANIYADPEAAEFVFSSGIPITLVGLDVTMKTLLPRNYIEEWRKLDTPLNKFLVDITTFYINAYSNFYPSINGCALHDPLAIGVVIDPSFVKTESMYIQVDTEGEISKGRTIPDLRPGHPKPNMEVCVEVDSARFLDHFVNRLLGTVDK
jgi:purine nucleosidase